MKISDLKIGDQLKHVDLKTLFVIESMSKRSVTVHYNDECDSEGVPLFRCLNERMLEFYVKVPKTIKKTLWVTVYQRREDGKMIPSSAFFDAKEKANPKFDDRYYRCLGVFPIEIEYEEEES